MVNNSLILALALIVSASRAAGRDEQGIAPVDRERLDPGLLEQVQALGEHARSVRDDAMLRGLTGLPDTPPGQAPIGSEGASAGLPEGASPHPLGEGRRTLIFVSWSMGATAIKDILESYDGLAGVGVVFRGIPDGLSMAAALGKLQHLTQETQSTVSILLDPLAFQRHAIGAVPSIALESATQGLIAKASGSASVSYLEAAVKEGKRGDLGTLGATQAISEPDLMLLLQQRIAALDAEGLKQRAIQRFWDNHRGTPLPPAVENATRRVDPSVIIPEAILDAQGAVVQPAGRVNPLDLRPFAQKLVVIDPTQPWQVALAKAELAQTAPRLTVTVLATQIPADVGWPLFNRVQEALDAPLYLLLPDMAERFQIRRAPSVVTADARHFIVREIARPMAMEVKDAPR